MNQLQPVTHIDAYGFKSVFLGPLEIHCATNETLHRKLSREIGYIRDTNGNFAVTDIATGVRIIVSPGAFFRITGADRRSIAGRHVADIVELAELGFHRTEVCA